MSRARFMAGSDQAIPAEEPSTIGTWVLEVLADLDHQTPLVVVVDDAHWADTDSLRSILFAARRLVAERALMVFAVREVNVLRLPEGLHRLAAGATGLLLPLSNLGAEDLQQLARASGVRELPARTARRLREHTGGNPLYVRALLAELPHESRRTWEPTLPAPPSLAEHVQRRLAPVGTPASVRCLCLSDSRTGRSL